MLTYDYILEGSGATEENAIAAANGMDWQAIEKTDNKELPFLDYKGEYNGIEIWYCYAGDIYIFTDSEDDTIVNY